jgi:hypothetical protein
MSDTEFAKSHLRDHLNSLIVSPIAEGFWSIYSSARELCERNNQPDQVLRTFQNMLTKIPEWSDSTLSTEVERIEKVTNCSYLDDLIMGVFIAYMKSFASLHYTGSAKEVKVDFDRPSLAKFFHEMYIHSARKLWQTAYLMKTDVSTEVQARNRQEVEKIVSQCLEQVIRSFLPWQAITKKYFSTPQEVIEELPEPEPEPEPEVEEQTKTVTFSQESDEEDIPKLKISEEDATLEVSELDVKQVVASNEESNPMDELEKKVSDTLVLNL